MMERMTLFPPDLREERAEPAVPGLRYLPGFLSPDEQEDAIRRIDANDGAWLADLSRRVQQYGWRYDYAARAVTPDMRIGPLPDWLQTLAERLYATGCFDRAPEQVIINEYEPGQGIAMHADHPGFGPAVAMVSLGDDWEMDFSQSGEGKRTASLLLERGSALALTGEARREWRHGIAKRRRERGGRERKRRLSLTFRTVRAGATDTRFPPARE